MPGGDRGIATAQEFPADRKATKSPGLLDAGLLQQRQRLSTGADEDESGFDVTVFTGAAVADRQCPPAVAPAMQVAYLVTEQHGRPVARGVADELLGQRAEVDVGAV